MNYMNIILIRITDQIVTFYPLLRMSLSFGYTCVLQKTTMSQKLPQKQIFIDNFTDLSRYPFSGL